GYSSTLPSGWVGDCFSTVDMSCNKKIIGGGWFYEGFASGGNAPDLTEDWLSPRDSSGHGTMCAGVAAGNSNVQPNIGEDTDRASGMAPGARLAIYKVLWQSGGGNIYATSPDIFAAIDQAVADGVDVLSLAMEQANSDDTYFDDLPFISVNAAGVFVALAAGNKGHPHSTAPTGYRTLCNFSPFYLTVGAITISRNGASISSTTPTPAAAELPAPTVLDFSSAGPLARPSGPIPTAAHPSNAILKPDIIAPGDSIVAAVSTNVVGDAGGFWWSSGTSQATAHVTGIAALIIQQHPDWTPAQIMSAMTTTARTTDTRKKAIKTYYWGAATPWEMGAGHVVPARVVNPGLTYDAGEQDFINFLAGQDYNRARDEFGTDVKALSARNLNRPAISLPKVRNKAKVRRTVTNVADTTSTYKVRIKKPAGVDVRVSPSRFTIAPGQRKTFKVTVVVRWASQSFKFGSITWVDGHGHSVRSVLAVQPFSVW
ncbi:unnamed protein product, partial [Closterium sp. Naga37s-1]